MNPNRYNRYHPPPAVEIHLAALGVRIGAWFTT
jgi:hypothetical protein